MIKKDLPFDQLMAIYNHVGKEERHFNSLELVVLAGNTKFVRP